MVLKSDIGAVTVYTPIPSFNANVPLGVVSRAIGHTRVSTTTDVYLEVLPKDIYGIRGKLPALNLPSTKSEQNNHSEQGDTSTS